MPRDIAPSASLPRGLARARVTRRRPALPARLLSLIGLARQRRHLAELDAHLLQDVGLTRSEAEREAGRAFWDAPSHWRG